MSRRIVEYDVIEGTTIPELVGEMEAAIAEGWEPFGSLRHHSERVVGRKGPETLATFFQPIVRYVEHVIYDFDKGTFHAVESE